MLDRIRIQRIRIPRPLVSSHRSLFCGRTERERGDRGRGRTEREGGGQREREDGERGRTDRERGTCRRPEMREKTALKLLIESAKMTLEARFFSWSRPESPYVVGRSLRNTTQIKIIYTLVF